MLKNCLTNLTLTIYNIFFLTIYEFINLFKLFKKNYLGILDEKDPDIHSRCNEILNRDIQLSGKGLCSMDHL